MTRPYSLDLRQRMVRALGAGAARRATAAKFEVSLSYVIELLQRKARHAPYPDALRTEVRLRLDPTADLVQAAGARLPGPASTPRCAPSSRRMSAPAPASDHLVQCARL